MSESLHCLEHWLVLDRRVFDAIGAYPAAAGGVLEFRRGQQSIELVSLAEMPRHLLRSKTIGRTRVNVLAQRLTPAIYTEMRYAAVDGVAVHLYDWYQWPGRVISALDAPDSKVADRLASGKSADPILLWPPLPNVRDDQRRTEAWREALACWERLARDEHGEAFDDLYGAQPIDWARLWPLLAGDKQKRGWNLARDGLLSLFRFRALPAPGTLPGLALDKAAAEFVADLPPLQWTYEIEAGRQAHLRIDLPSQAGTNIELQLILESGIRPPRRIVLMGEASVLIELRDLAWVEDTQRRELMLYRAIEDEFGDLRTRLAGLRVRPDLVLT